MPKLNPRLVEKAVKWLPSAITYGTAGGCAVLYFTDWKEVLQYMPYYNTKFN